MRRTAKDSAKTREKILDVSLKVFGQKGFGQTKLSDIAKEAEITRGAIYHHFNSKSELFSALFEKYHEKRMQVIRPLALSEDATLNKIKRGIKEFFYLLENDQSMVEFQKIQFLKQEIHCSNNEESIVKDHVDVYLDILISNIKEGKKCGEIRPDVDAEEFVFFLSSFIYGIINHWLFFNQSFVLSELGYNYIESFVDLHLKNK